VACSPRCVLDEGIDGAEPSRAIEGPHSRPVRSARHVKVGGGPHRQAGLFLIVIGFCVARVEPTDPAKVP
jgi:hypothetical protein